MLIGLGNLIYFFYYFMIKAMDDMGVVMTPFGDIVSIILVVNLKIPNTRSRPCRLILQSS